MAKLPRVSIIIVNYNSSRDSTRCVESVLECSNPGDYEILIVDNASTNEEFGALLESCGSKAKIIRSDVNLGFGGANNLGAARAGGEYLFFLNPDTYLQNDAIGAFLRFMDSPEGRGAGAVGCSLTDAEGRVNHSSGDFESASMSQVLKRELLLVLRVASRFVRRRRLRREAALREWTEGSAPRSVDWITGADLFLRRNAFEEVGGFDDRIFLYSEEVELQRRLRRRGWSRWLIDDARVVHTHARFQPEGGSGGVHMANGQFSYFLINYPLWMVAMAFAIYKAAKTTVYSLDSLAGERQIRGAIHFAARFKLVSLWKRFESMNR